MCEANNYRSTAAHTAAAPKPTRDGQWEKLEARFRLWSFRVYYDKIFASEPDLVVRFVKAIAASSKPIRKRELVYEWDRLQQERRARRRHREQHQHDDVAAVPE